MGGMLDDALTVESIVLLGDLKTLLGTTGSYSWSNLNPGSVLLFDFCASHSSSTLSTMLEYKGIQWWTWYQNTLGERSMIEIGRAHV